MMAVNTRGGIKGVLAIISASCIFLLSCLFFIRPVMAGEELVLGVHPYLRHADLVERFSPIAEYFSSSLGQSVRIEIAEDYQAHIQSVGENRFDIAYLGPGPYVRVVDGYGARPILGKFEIKGRNSFRGVIIVRENSDLNKLSELAGKRFAFGDPNSTMSHIIPRYMLRQAGITTDRLGGFEHVPNHMAVALGVLSGRCDAGAVKEEVFHKYKKRGLKALVWTPPIATHLFVARADLPEKTIITLRKALLLLREDTYGSVILHAIKPSITGMTPGQDSDFDNLRTILHSLDKAGVAP